VRPFLLAQALHTHVTARRIARRAAPRAISPLAATRAAAERGGVVSWSTCWTRSCGTRTPTFFSYTLSKAALEAANTMLALALSAAVRVVGVAPGLTLTSHLLSDAKFEALHKLSPLGRSSTPQMWPPRCCLRCKTSPSPAPRCWWTVAST
jgi:NAD(P)-dependent dehydrogenase (short-subunit alcohol dehydrogenase family)